MIFPIDGIIRVLPVLSGVVGALAVVDGEASLSGAVLGGTTAAALAGIIVYLLTKFIPAMMAEHRATIIDLTTKHENAVKALSDAQTNERKEHRSERQGAVDAIRENTIATRQLADAVNKIAKDE